MTLSQNQASPTARHRDGLGRSIQGTPRLFALLCAAVLVVPAATAYLVSSLSSPTYAAEAEVLFVSTTDNATSDDQAIATQVALLTSRPVLQPVAAAFDMSVAQLDDAISAEREGRSNIISFTTEGTDRDQVLAIAQAVNDSALQRASGRSQQSIAEQAYLASRIADLEAQLSDVLANRGDTQVVSEQLVALQAQVTELDAPPEPPIEILTAPYLQDEPVSPRPERAAAAGLLVGILIATGLLLWRRRALVASPSSD